VGHHEEGSGHTIQRRNEGIRFLYDENHSTVRECLLGKDNDIGSNSGAGSI